MSLKTPWFGTADPRPTFLKKCKKQGAKVIMGPSNVAVSKDYRNPKLARAINWSKYDLVLLDDNMAKGGWGTRMLCKLARKHNIPVIGSPHGNSEFKKISLQADIGDIFDYSFVFGHKERRMLRKGGIANKLLPGGIPANDILANYKRRNKYILIIVSYVTKCSMKRNVNGYLPFTEHTYLSSGIADIQQKEGLPVIVKEKSRFKKGLDFSLKGLEKKYAGVSVVMDHPDNNRLVADAAVVISSPSTLCFKSIQMGIPTILLRNFGMIGNFYDFDGLTNCNKSDVLKAYNRQKKRGLDKEFIIDTLEGGIDFSSTQIYLKHIDNIMNQI